MLLSLHLHVLHLLGGGQLLLLHHLLVLDGGSVLLSGHLVLLLVALRSILDEVGVWRGIHHLVTSGVWHSVPGWWDGLALVSVIELLTLFKYSVTAIGHESNVRQKKHNLTEKLTYLINCGEVLSTVLVNIIGLITKHFPGKLVQNLRELFRNGVLWKVLAGHFILFIILN